MARAGAFVSKLEAELIVWKHRGGPPPKAKNVAGRFSTALKSLLANRHLLSAAQRQRLIREMALAQEVLASDADPAESRQSPAGLKSREPHGTLRRL